MEVKVCFYKVKFGWKQTFVYEIYVNIYVWNQFILGMYNYVN